MTSSRNMFNEKKSVIAWEEKKHDVSPEASKINNEIVEKIKEEDFLNLQSLTKRPGCTIL